MTRRDPRTDPREGDVLYQANGTRQLLVDFDYRAAAIEFRVDCPEPGTDTARLLICAHNSRQRAARLETENLKLLAEIDEWKNASGLEKGGDPDAVTPDDLRNDIAHLRAAQDKSWGAADEALLAEHEAEMAKVCLVIEQFCRQCEYRPDPGSCSDCPLQPYGGASNG